MKAITILLPFDQKALIEVNGLDFNENQKLFIESIKEFAQEAMEIIQEKELNWAAKLANMTNKEYAISRCKLMQRDLNKLGKLGCNIKILK